MSLQSYRTMSAHNRKSQSTAIRTQFPPLHSPAMQAACHQVLAGANSAILRKTNCPVAPAESPGLPRLFGGGLAEWGYGLSVPGHAPSPPPALVLQSSAPQIHS